MVVWSTLDATCPVCSQRMRLRMAGGGFAMGQDSDLLLRMGTRHVIQVEIHSCPRCRFSGYINDFLRDFPPGVLAKFRRDVSPRLGEAKWLPAKAARESADRHSPLPDVQYYWAAKTAAAMGLPALEVGTRLLRAYWCLRLAPSRNLPPRPKRARKTMYLKAAIRKLREALNDDSDPHLEYVVAELCRRNGNFRLAVTHFNRFVQGNGGAKYLKKAAQKLLAAARAKNPRGLTMEEVLYDKASDGNGPGAT